MDRFWSKVEKSDECWDWTAGKVRNGYGRFWFDGAMKMAHRVAYELEIGPIPDGLQLDHLCRNRACVNPSHLEPVTNAENTRRGDMTNVGMHNASKTHCPKGHPYSDENTYVATRTSGSTHRQCRICKRAAWRECKARKKVAA